MIWKEKQADILKSQNCFLTEWPPRNPANWSVVILIGWSHYDKGLYHENIKIIWSSIISAVAFQMLSNF